MIEFLDRDQFYARIFDPTKNEEWEFRGPRPALVNFYADWCGPCKVFAPVLERISQELEGKIDVFKVNIDQAPEIPELFGVKGVPTTLFIAGPTEPAVVSGSMNADELRHTIRELMQVR